MVFNLLKGLFCVFLGFGVTTTVDHLHILDYECHITCLASCKNGEAEERDKGVGAMVYVATGWTYSEMCVLWKHNAI